MSPEVMKPESYQIVRLALSLADADKWFIASAEKEDEFRDATSSIIWW